MELRQLRFFVEVARAGSFMGAADRLHVAQPSLWRQVKALEAELGVALFERSGRAVKITSAGSTLLPRAAAQLAQAESFQRLSAELARGRAGAISIACAFPHVARFLAPLIGGFHDDHPGVHIALHDLPGLPPIDQVLTGEVDFLTGLPQAHAALRRHRLGEVRLIAVMAEDHPWRSRDQIWISQLRDEPVLIAGHESLTRKLLEPALREHGFELTVTRETSNAPGQVALARAGLGVALLADDALGADPGPWPALIDDRYPMMTTVWIYWLREVAAPPVEAFARYLTSGQRGLGEEPPQTTPIYASDELVLSITLYRRHKKIILLWESTKPSSRLGQPGAQ